MSFILRTAVKDLRRRLRDPLSLIIWFVLPAFIGGVLKLAFGGPGGPPPKAHVLIVDEDGSVVSRLLVGGLAGGDTAPFRTERVERADGERRIEAGQATALLVIPAGFGGAVLRDQPTTLRLVTNPAQRILPALVRETVDLAPEVVFYAHRFFPAQLRDLAARLDAREPPTPMQLAESLAAVDRILRTLGPQVSPPALAVSIEAARKEKPDAPRPGFTEMFLPSLLLMTLLFIASGLSEDMWVERDMGTLRRTLMAPRSATALLAGKMLAGGVFFFAVTVASLALARWGFGLSAHHLALAALWASASGVVLLLLMTLLQLHASSHRTGGLLANLILLPLLMLGGSLFPFEAMPAWMAAIGRYTPNGWALVRLRAILEGRLDGTMGSILGLAAFSVILFAWASRRLGGRFVRGA